MVLAPDEGGVLRAYVGKTYPDKKTAAKIGGEPITAAYTFPLHDFVLLRTESGDHLRTLANRPLDDEQWADFFFEPHTNSLYRMDSRGNWYDTEGVRLAIPVFRRGEVLVSLPGKASLRSWAFGEQPVVCSPNVRLVQVGKLVYDLHLQTVSFFGERVTGLGRVYVSFGGQDAWQEVMLGIDRRGYVNEHTGQPLLINGEPATGYVGGITRGNRHFEVFRSATRKYVLEDASDGDLRYAGRPLSIDLETYNTLGGREIVKANDGQRTFYFDLTTREPFQLPVSGGELILNIAPKPLHVGDSTLYNLRTEREALVYDDKTGNRFRIGDDDTTAVAVAPGFENDFFFATIGGRRRLCSVHSGQLVELGRQKLQVGKLLGKAGAKLLNAQSVSGAPLVIDLREGAAFPELGVLGDRRILRTVGPSLRIGERVLQHVEVDSRGGAIPRVTDLQEPQLAEFTLPRDLTIYPDQKDASGFAGNPLLRVDFLEPVTVLGHEFFPAVFLSDMGDERPVLLQAGNARPLHVDGARHRNELVTAFSERNPRPDRIGEHRMVSVRTLNEELEEGQMLLSIDRGKTWLPFYESFLPVFRRALHIPEIATWDCVLFEALGPGGAGEYVAVERNKPHRVLARKSRKGVEPRIITSKTRVLTDPEEMSTIAKFFLDPGMLVEVD